MELNEAYIGVIEVLSRYLQSADQELPARSIRVAELSRAVGQEMKLTTRQLDDIRVAALLHDIEHLEITAKVIEKAVGRLEQQSKSTPSVAATSRIRWVPCLRAPSRCCRNRTKPT